jgi:hypothetical protein
VRYSGAEGLGHVGWAFDLGGGLADCGAVEDARGMPSADPAQMGFWTEATADPVALMATHDPVYDALKYVDVAVADARAAYATVVWVSEQPYTLFGRNCMDDVYDVLRSFGVPGLPPPVLHWVPNNWFAAFGGTPEPMTFAWTPAPLSAAAAAPALQAVNAAHAAVQAVAPAWRVPGTAEWHDLQAQMAAASPIPSVQSSARVR